MASMALPSAETAANMTGSERTNGSASLRHANGHTSENARAGIPTYRPFRPQLQDPSLLPDGRHPLSGISLRAFCLGIALGCSSLAVAILAYFGSPLWRTPFFLVCLSAFHFLEFWAHAAYNTPLATVSAFLLDANGNAYKAAHVTAFLETTVMHSVLHYPRVFPASVQQAWLAVGFFIVVIGQISRTLALVHCGRNFNHTMQTYRRAEHELVTRGIYAFLRHPSYFGFFWWAIGTQVVLGNWLCLTAYMIVLWRFFSHRISREEEYLVEFFGKEYEDFRAHTGVWIPFIR